MGIRLISRRYVAGLLRNSLNKTYYLSKNMGQPHKKGRIRGVGRSIDRRHIFMMSAVGKVVLVFILAILGCYGS